MSWVEYLRQHGCGEEYRKARSYSSRHSYSGQRYSSQSDGALLTQPDEAVFMKNGTTFALTREGRYLTLRIRDNQGYESLLQLTDHEWETVLEIIPKFLAASFGT